MKMTATVFTIFCLLCFAPYASAGEEESVYRITDQSGQVLAHICGPCEAGDEYISASNAQYRIFSVNEEAHTAEAEYTGMANMPDISWLTGGEAQPVSAAAKRLIALYCTHSDESYIKGDGTESSENRGGIYDIADLFAGQLKKLGTEVELNTETHHPHDAGAYRRSRQTALALLKQQPDAIFDLHRDGIPNPDEYAATVSGKEMSKVRLLVGKSNQNKDANLSFAKKIKAVADRMYPGLIKDIYIGKGTYNQDLAPHSVLLEFGTHTLPKSRVEASVEPMAEVVYRTVFGGVVGSAGASDVSGNATGKEVQPLSESNEGSGAALWIIIALIAGLGVFAFLSAGRRGGAEKWKHSFSEMTGGLLGKRPRR